MDPGINIVDQVYQISRVIYKVFCYCTRLPAVAQGKDNLYRVAVISHTWFF